MIRNNANDLLESKFNNQSQIDEIMGFCKKI
jgi:hypothetical protein